MKKIWISIFKDVERENLKKEYSNKIKKKNKWICRAQEIKDSKYSEVRVNTIDYSKKVLLTRLTSGCQMKPDSDIKSSLMVRIDYCS